jgi:hypothetical protein
VRLLIGFEIKTASRFLHRIAIVSSGPAEGRRPGDRNWRSVGQHAAAGQLT